jgi:hypothetical protein
VLHEALGLPPGAAVRVASEISLPSRLELPSERALLTGLEERRLDLVALRRGYESQDQTLRAAVLAQFPRITLGFHQASDTTNVHTTGFGVTIDLPIFDRNQGHIAIEQATELAHLQPPGIEIAVTALPIGLHQHERGGAAPPTQVPAIAAGFELPALFAEAAMAFQRGGNVNVLLPAGLHDGVTPRVGVKQDHDLDASGGLELPDELGRPCGGCPAGDAHGPTMRLFDIPPDAPGDHLLAEDQDAAHVLGALHLRVARRILHRGHRVHHLASFRLLGIIDEQRARFPPLGVQGSEQLLSLLAQGGLGVPPLHQAEVIATGPVPWGIQIPLQVGDMAPTPHTGDGHDQQAEVRVMIPVKVPLQGPEKLVKGGRHTYDADHGAILLRPPVSGTWIPFLAIQRGLPLLPHLSTPSHHRPLKSQST